MNMEWLLLVISRLKISNVVFEFMEILRIYTWKADRVFFLGLYVTESDTTGSSLNLSCFWPVLSPFSTLCVENIADLFAWKPFPLQTAAQMDSRLMKQYTFDPKCNSFNLDWWNLPVDDWRCEPDWRQKKPYRVKWLQCSSMKIRP